MKSNYVTWILTLALTLISIFSIFLFKPRVQGDSVSYVETINVLNGSSPDISFVPNRFVSTFAPIQILRMIPEGLRLFAWLFMNVIFYVATGIIFYFLLKKIFSHTVAVLGTVLLSVNYAIVTSGLSYMMDIGGWFFYILGIYLSFEYLDTGDSKKMWLASIVIGIGGLFKEYAFLAGVTLVGCLIYHNWRGWINIIWKTTLVSFIVFGPVLAVNIYSYIVYKYTYLSWLFHQQNLYPGQFVLLEYIKSFGSLYNFGWFLFIPGAYYFFKEFLHSRFNFSKKTFYVFLVCLSCIPVFVWPVVTRVLFVTVPALILVSAYFMERATSKLSIMLVALSLPTGFFMDYILPLVNIEVVAGVLVSIFICLFYILLILALGLYLTHHFFSKNYRGYSISFFVGLGVFGIYWFLLLIFHAFTNVMVLGLPLIVLIYGGFTNRKVFTKNKIIERFHNLKNYFKDFFKTNRVMTIILVAVIVVITLLNAVPITAGDALNYHLPFVRDMIFSHRLNYPIGGITEQGYGFFPAETEVIYAGFLLSTGFTSIDMPIVMLHLAVLLAFVFCLYEFLQSFIRETYIRLSTILLLFLMPDFYLMLVRPGMIDLFVNSCLILSLIIFVKGFKEEDYSSFWPGAFFLGLALSMKLTAIIALSYVIFIIFLKIILSKRDFGQKLFKAIFGPAILVFLLASYWYLHNLFVFGNPIYPLLTKVGLDQGLRSTMFLPSTWWGVVFQPILIYLPFLFTNTASRLTSVEFLVALFAYGSSALLWLRTRRLSFPVAFLLGYTLFYDWVVSSRTNDIRHILSTLIVLVIVTGINLDELILKWKVIYRRYFIIVFCIGFFLVFSFITRIYMDRFYVALGFETEKSYLQRSITGSYTMEGYYFVKNFLKKD